MLEQTISRIGLLNQAAMTAAERHQGLLAIPRGSLGRLHEFCVRLAGITGNPRPEITDLALITMAGDHGVADQGVSLFPQEVTREMVANFAQGGAAINVLARHIGARLTVVDMGVAGPLPALPVGNDSSMRLIHRRVGHGTADMSRGPAMSRDEAIQSLEAGIQVFGEERSRGLHAVGTGDMGIANTTPSSAIAAVMLKCAPEDVVNQGTGIDGDALRHKVEVVARSLSVNKPDREDPLDVLAKVGGFEIGGIAGVILAACAARTPVVVDGFISTAAALLASRFHPGVRDYLFAGHQSAVLGHKLMLDDLALSPMVDLGMRLGEGTGAAFGLSILVAASRISREMLTFDEAEVSDPQAGRQSP
ncbi:MAG TPA: nicotinate-nucleotide--dimethylbenzimidazole phosphoribosyltransferase [Desulfomonilaceae bacterium]|nr:nicotinate-nucleotide--dimethylbenzimidazole phosphoribosyltransferase [Desulfomonilaceae bacterium]